MLTSLAMPLPTSRFTGLLPLMLLFVASPARSQQDTLEQPYEPNEPAGTAPATESADSSKAGNNPAPAPAAQVTPAPAPVPVSGVVPENPRADNRPLGPLRARRRLALTGELGWNGIAGFGPVLSYHVVPHFTVEFGAGLSLTGWKGGVRGRYNFLTGSVTPFIGAGMMSTGGLGEVTADFNDHSSDPGAGGTDEVTIRVRPSAFLQAVGGVDWTTPGGFTLISSLGWAELLNHNLDIVAGTPSRDAERAFDIVFGSGLVITVSTGYTFR